MRVSLKKIGKKINREADHLCIDANDNKFVSKVTEVYTVDGPYEFVDNFRMIRVDNLKLIMEIVINADTEETKP